jgi:hypothetical protein
MDAREVAKTYFERMRARDLGVVDLFHDDASLIGLGDVKSGKDAIREFYKGSIEGASPSPSLVGDLLASGSRVAAEIRIKLADGSEVHAVDVFVVEEGRIRSLTYFIADH